MGFEPTTSRLLSRVLYQLPAASYFLRLSFSELSDAAYCQNPLQSSWLGYSALTQATWVRGPVAEFMHLPSPAWRGQRNLLSHNRSSSRIEWGSRLFSVTYLGASRKERGLLLHRATLGTLVLRFRSTRSDRGTALSAQCAAGYRARPRGMEESPLSTELCRPPPIDLRVRQHVQCMLRGFYGWCQAGYSSVGRASDCRACRDQMIPVRVAGFA